MFIIVLIQIVKMARARVILSVGYTQCQCHTVDCQPSISAILCKAINSRSSQVEGHAPRGQRRTRVHERNTHIFTRTSGRTDTYPGKFIKSLYMNIVMGILQEYRFDDKTI